jgi:sugar phosphate isomerase/epimerase
VKQIHLGGTARSPDQVRSLYHLGLQFAELPITNLEEFQDKVKTYRDLREELGLYYLCHGPREGDPNNPVTLSEQYLPKLKAILRIMSKMEMSLLTIHLWLDQRFVKGEMIDFKIGLLDEITRRAEEAGITVCHENLSERASDLEIPLREIPLLHLTLDLGHAQLLSKVNTSYGFMERYPDRIRHIHIHDNRGGRSPLEDLHLPPGEGIIEFEPILAKLTEIGHAETMTLELKPHEISRCLDRVRKMLGPKGYGND